VTRSPSAGTVPSVVLFDLDDTLFAHSEAVGRGVTAHRATLAGAVSRFDDDAEIARWHALEELHYHRYLAGELDFLAQRRARVHDFVAPYGLEIDEAGAERWYDEYYLEYEKAWALHPDAVPCLDELRRTTPGVQFGIVTNGELAYQSQKVTAVGLDRYVEHIIASGELCITKPDARIFHHACELFDVPPAAAAYVGDRLHTDAIGASRAGLTGVWLDRRGTATDEDLVAAAASGVLVIRSLAELPPLLASLPA
jgi:putative hydrolase of the HAD superfamily